jgi:flagellar biosynthesis/type III secretory pathway protein FliH
MHTERRIIKAGAPLPARRIEAAVWDTDRRVREMVATAEAHARRIVADAEAERGRVFAEAVEAGRAEGHARAAALLASAAAQRERTLAGLQREIVRLAIEVARKVLASELAERPEAVAELAATALAAARDRREATLRVNPADAAALRNAEGRLATLVGRAQFAIREDPAIERGGAVVDTEVGRLDAGIDTQLTALARALEEAGE